MSHAQMIAKAWLDDGYRASLLAQGIVVPPPPNDLTDEELDTSAYAPGERPQSASLSNWLCSCQRC